MIIDNGARYSGDARGGQIARVQKKENIIQKSFDKLKETGKVCDTD